MNDRHREEKLGPALRAAGDNIGCGIALGLMVAAAIIGACIVHAAYVAAGLR